MEHSWGRVEVYPKDLTGAKWLEGYDLPTGYAGCSSTSTLGEATRAWVEDGHSITSLTSHTFDHADSQEWEEHGFTPYQATTWARFKLTPAEASEWRSAGVRASHVAYQATRHGCSIEMYEVLKQAAKSCKGYDKAVTPRRMNRAIAFRDHVRAVGVEVSDAEAARFGTRWGDGEWDQDAAVALCVAGVTFAQAEEIAAELGDGVAGIISVVIDGVPLEWAVAYGVSQARLTA